MKIAFIPKEFKVFFNRFRDLFSKRQFFYFGIYTYGLLVMPKEKKNVSQIAAASMTPVCRSSLERFICEVRWEFTNVMKRAKTQVIRKLSHLPRGKRVVELVIDDTDVEKFGESVFGVGWYKHTEEEPWRAIQLVVLGVLIGDWLVPLDFRIYVPMKVCKYIPMQFETKLEMAAEMLKKLKLPQGLNVGVMFDSWYLCPTVTQAVVEKNYSWYSRCRSNRNIQWEGDEEKEKKKRTKKKTIRLDKYAPTIKWQPLDYRTNRKNPAVVGHQRIGNL